MTAPMWVENISVYMPFSVMKQSLKKGSHLLGPKEIDGLLLTFGEAYKLLTDHLITS